MAAIIEPILNERREESPATRRVLERVPGDKLSWKPHPKSRSLGELAMHLASIPKMAERIATTEEFTPGTTPPPTANSAEEIRDAFEKNCRAAEEHLRSMNDEAAQAKWRLVFRGKEIF